MGLINMVLSMWVCCKERFKCYRYHAMDRMLALQYIRTDNERIPFPSVAGYVGCAHLYNVSCVSPAQIQGRPKFIRSQFSSSNTEFGPKYKCVPNCGFLGQFLPHFTRSQKLPTRGNFKRGKQVSLGLWQSGKTLSQGPQTLYTVIFCASINLGQKLRPPEFYPTLPLQQPFLTHFDKTLSFKFFFEFSTGFCHFCITLACFWPKVP